MKAECPVCGIDARNPHNLAAHIKAKHPDYLKPEKKKPGPARKYATDEEAYDARKAHAATKSRQVSAAGRDIAPLPEVKDPERRARCAASLLEHCRVYHPAKFFLPFSQTHLKAIAKAERAILKGGVFALAMPRGSGKSEICKRAAEWAVLNGYRRFVVLVGATGPLADDLMADIQAQLETNDRLAEDYPEACYPIRRLGRILLRAKGQLFNGEPTRLEWTTSQVTLAHLPGSVCAGATITTAGITASFRGLSVPGPDGGTIRPDLVIVDDPQTRESATSLTQTRSRESVINGDILGLAGPVRQIACLLPCTVIAPGDLADRLLDRQLSPLWQGERSKLVEAFPTNEALWDEYLRIRDEDLRADGDGLPSRRYYEANRAEMDAGAVLSWPERFDPDAYASAIEEAMCYRHYKPEAFAAEMQNEPQLAAEIAAGSLTVAGLKEKVGAVAQGAVPREAVHLTAGIDVGKDILYWTVTAWTEAGGGAVVDYGTFPKQNRPFFTARDARPTLTNLYPNMDEQARVYAGLRAVTEQLFGREWPRDQASGAGGHLRLERGLVDSGWNTELVKRFCRQSPFAALLVPSKGFGITATAAPMSAWGRKQGQRWFNAHCMVNHDRLCNFDSNYHKSQVANRLLTPPGGLGCVYLPSGDHAHFVEHLASEYRVTATADRQGRKVDEWKLKPGGPDNHWWDSLILSAVAATTLGVRYKAQAAAAAGAVPAASPGPSGDSGSARRVPAAPVGGSGGAGQRKAQGKGRRTLGEMMREKRAEAQGAYPWMSR